MTTITKFAVLTTTLTNNIVELLTSTETETETVTRHSTRTVQVVTTQTNRYTFTKSITETETSTTFSLVPYTITEVETMTRTIESTILTTFTIPASTIHKTIFSTVTEKGKVTTMTEYLQPLIETIATETIMATETKTTATTETVIMTVHVPVAKQETEPEIEGDYRIYDYDPVLLEDLYDESIDQAGVETVMQVEIEQDGFEIEADEEEMVEASNPEETMETVQGDDEEDASTPMTISADINDYPVSQSIMQEEFEFVSQLPSGAELLNGDDSMETGQEAPADTKIIAAIQRSPFMAAQAQNQQRRIY